MFGIRSLPRTLEAALRDLGHAKNETRISALRDLVRLTETDARPQALRALCEVLGSDADLHVRAAAALALGDAGAKESREALLAAARNAPLQVREMALAALGELGDPGDSEILALLEQARIDAAPRAALSSADRLEPLGALQHPFAASRRQPRFGRPKSGILPFAWPKSKCWPTVRRCPNRFGNARAPHCATTRRACAWPLPSYWRGLEMPAART